MDDLLPGIKAAILSRLRVDDSEDEAPGTDDREVARARLDASFTFAVQATASDLPLRLRSCAGMLGPEVASILDESTCARALTDDYAIRIFLRLVGLFGIGPASDLPLAPEFGFRVMPLLHPVFLEGAGAVLRLAGMVPV